MKHFTNNTLNKKNFETVGNLKSECKSTLARVSALAPLILRLNLKHLFYLFIFWLYFIQLKTINGRVEFSIRNYVKKLYK